MPFREKNFISRKAIFSFSLMASLCFVAFGLMINHENGMPERRIAQHLPSNYFEESWIRHKPIGSIDGNLCVSDEGSLCRVTNTAGGKKILLVGDSHSVDYSTEFRDYLSKSGHNGWQLSIGGCAFIEYHLDRHNGGCRHARKLIETAASEIKFDVVLFIGNMDKHFTQLPDDKFDINIQSLDGLFSIFLDNGSTLVYFTPRPYFKYEPPKAARLNKFEDLRAVTDSSNEFLQNNIIEMAKKDRFYIYDQANELLKAGCGMPSCFNGHTNSLMPLYRDSTHLTTLGARVGFAPVANIIEQAAR